MKTNTTSWTAKDFRAHKADDGYYVIRHKVYWRHLYSLPVRKEDIESVKDLMANMGWGWTGGYSV